MLWAAGHHAGKQLCLHTGASGSWDHSPSPQAQTVASPQAPALQPRTVDTGGGGSSSSTSGLLHLPPLGPGAGPRWHEEGGENSVCAGVPGPGQCILCRGQPRWEPLGSPAESAQPAAVRPNRSCATGRKVLLVSATIVSQKKCINSSLAGRGCARGRAWHSSLRNRRTQRVCNMQRWAASSQPGPGGTEQSCGTQVLSSLVQRAGCPVARGLVGPPWLRAEGLEG